MEDDRSDLMGPGATAPAQPPPQEPPLHALAPPSLPPQPIQTASASSGQALTLQPPVEQLADAEARRWWSEREAKVEKDLALSLHRRLETQRGQIHAFKMEQSKWEHELQLRVAKYAHDRKLLSEHNLELQEALTLTEEKYARLERERDLQSTRILELEGQLLRATSAASVACDLQQTHEELRQRLLHVESCRAAEVAAAAANQRNDLEGLIADLESRLAAVLADNADLRDVNKPGRRDRIETSQGDATPSTTAMQNDDGCVGCMTRILELEKTCKQKDQNIHALKAMLERHEAISDEKTRLIKAKYDQVKAINVAMQSKLLQALTDEPLMDPRG